MRFSALILSFVLAALSFSSYGAIDLIGASELKKQLGIEDLVSNSEVVENLKNLKIAVIDNGFGRFNAKKNLKKNWLPHNTQMVASYSQEFIKKHNLNVNTKGNALKEGRIHGLLMAKIIWETTGKNKEGPQFILLNGNGFTQFKRAVQYSIDEKVDIVLYSQTWDTTGHFDGGGKINDVVNKATQAGVLWVNAAGNYGNKVYNGKLSSEGSKKLSFRSLKDEVSVNIKASWYPTNLRAEETTRVDLDLYVYDEDGEVVAKSELSQVKLSEEDLRTKTLYPREKLTFLSDMGTYSLKLKPRSSNVSGFKDYSVRVIVDGLDIDFEDRTGGGEIMIPADNPNVITVGGKSEQSATGPTTDGRQKPEIIFPVSEATFTNGYISGGTSNAAAYFVGVIILVSARTAISTREEVLEAFNDKNCQLNYPASYISPKIRIYLYALAKIEDKNLSIDLQAEYPLIRMGKSPAVLAPQLFRQLPRHMKKNGNEATGYRYFVKIQPDDSIDSYFYPKDGMLDLDDSWTELIQGHAANFCLE